MIAEFVHSHSCFWTCRISRCEDDGGVQEGGEIPGYKYRAKSLLGHSDRVSSDA